MRRKQQTTIYCDYVQDPLRHRPEDIHPIQLDRSYLCRFHVEFHEALHPALLYPQRAVRSKKKNIR